MPSIGSQSTAHLQLPLTEKLQRSSVQHESGPNSFVDLLSQGVDHVNNMQQDANSQIEELLTGGDVSQVEVYTAVQKADMAFRMLVQVRNKLMAAYDEINAIRV